jgi:hypothetical protein
MIALTMMQLIEERTSTTFRFTKAQCQKNSLRALLRMPELAEALTHLYRKAHNRPVNRGSQHNGETTSPQAKQT